MTERECPHCGAVMDPSKPCPVCELSIGAVAAPNPVEREGLARWWHNGRLAVLLAALCFAAATFAPLVSGLSVYVQGERAVVSVSLWDLALNTYPALKGRMSAWFVPGAAVFLLSLLRSRRAGPAMQATRPLLFAVALAPVAGVALPLLRLSRQHVSAGAAVALAAVGVALCVVAALRFGRDEPDAPKRRSALRDDDDD